MFPFFLQRRTGDKTFAYQSKLFFVMAFYSASITVQGHKFKSACEPVSVLESHSSRRKKRELRVLSPFTVM